MPLIWLKKETKCRSSRWKLKPVSTKATNWRKKKAKKKKQEFNWQKAEAIAEKQQRDWGGNNLLIENDSYYGNDISGTNSNQKDSFDPLQN